MRTRRVPPVYKVTFETTRDVGYEYPEAESPEEACSKVAERYPGATVKHVELSQPGRTVTVR